MAGLLDLPRTCPRGHPDMEEVAGEWAISGVDRRKPMNQLQALFQESPLAFNGSYFVLRIYRCAACGFVELVDKG